MSETTARKSWSIRKPPNVTRMTKYGTADQPTASIRLNICSAQPSIMSVSRTGIVAFKVESKDSPQAGLFSNS